MSSLLPVAVYGLKVPTGDVMISATRDFPASFRITMAAIDPSASPEHSGTTNGETPARATLKIIYDPRGDGDNDSSDADSEEEEYLRALLNGNNDDEDEESSSDEEEENGGPSDPSKSKKARKQAALEQIMKGLNEPSSDDKDEMDVDGDGDGKVNGDASKPKSKKGKGKASILDDDDEEEDDENVNEEEMEELVLCTLDPSKAYQQPLDITIAEDQNVFFKVSGTHAIYLTGNYVIPANEGHNHMHEVYNSEEDEENYDLSPDEDELDLLGEDDESDELDDLEDPRITEMASDEEENEAPKLIKNKQSAGKGNKKREAEDSGEEESAPKSVKEPASLDDIMAKSLKAEVPTANGEPKLSKKQLKRLKNNAGQAVAAAVENKNAKVEESSAKDSPATKSDKKVQFAKNLEQGPSPAKAPESKSTETKVEAKKQDAKKQEAKNQEADGKKNGANPKASLGPKVVQGVKIDDKKLGTGPAAKAGNKVGMRYIGKLEDGKVFDANKKGKPFTFKLGAGEVIKGWDIGVAGMSVGGERRIYVPANLAYGSKSQPGIPGNSPLIFDVKMLEIQ